MTAPREVSRRDFMRWTSLSGVALVVGVDALERVEVLAASARAASFEPSQWIRIDEAGVITIASANMEMGQGVRTAIPLIIVDELGGDFSKVQVVHVSPGPRHPSMGTSGSGSVMRAWTALRPVGAAAREMLIAAAAARWQVSPAECVAANSVVTHAASGRTASFGSLVAAASTLPVPANPQLRAPSEQLLLGRRVLRVDGPDIVTGQARFGCDVRVPGLRFAVIARTPQLGGRVARFDDARARAVAGVREVVEVPTGVAVIADRTWSAIRGRDALVIEWNHRDGAPDNSAAYRARLERALDTARQGRRDGDPDAVFRNASRTITQSYYTPFQPHAAMEPLNCIAQVRDGACEIWVGTQAPNRAQSQVAALLGIPVDRVTIHPQLMGGSFGRRLTNDFILEAVEVARRTSGPVQVMWTRSDDFHHDIYQPAQVNRMTAGLNADGFPIAWKHETADFHLTMFGQYDPNYTVDGDPWGAYDTPYEFQGLDVRMGLLEAPMTTGAWRAVGYPPAVFARESFLDEIAHLTGRDPVALRLALIPSPGNFVRAGATQPNGDRLRGVVRLVAERAGWSLPFARDRGGRRWGRGIACNSYHGGTMVAQVAEVSVGPRDDIRVHRVVSAVDCGQVINLAGLEGQFESGVIWALSSSLRSEMRFSNGRAAQSNFNDYRVVRMSESPVIETHVVSSPLRPFGVGEQPVPAVWPAVANAVFAATGRRLRSLPFMG